MRAEDLYYLTYAGHGTHEDHERNCPLFVKMANEWGFLNQIPKGLPKAYYRCREFDGLVDHLRVYLTRDHGTVYVFSPYMKGNNPDEDEEYERMMKIILKVKPTAIGVYFPKNSYHHPKSFTFVVKGPGRKRKLE